MTRHQGVWIDHDKAHIATLGPNPQVTTIESNAESRHKASGTAGVTPPGHLHGAPTHKYERRRQQELDRFYAAVIAGLAGADAVVILGPFPAREELKKAIGRGGLAPKLIAVEPAERMTEAQLVARLTELFRERLGSAREAPATVPVPRELARHGLRGQTLPRENPRRDARDALP